MGAERDGRRARADVDRGVYRFERAGKALKAGWVGDEVTSPALLRRYY
jgi:hypothetical protein